MALSRRHAMVSFASPQALEIVAEICQSFSLDNGAFTAWKRKKTYDFNGYLEFIAKWHKHPGCDFWLIPDVIDGSEVVNRELVAKWNIYRGAVPSKHPASRS